MYLPETIQDKLQETFLAFEKNIEDLKMSGAEAYLVGDFTQVTHTVEMCQKLMTLENRIRTCIQQFESQNQTPQNTGIPRHINRRVRKPRSQFLVKLGDTLIERATIADTLVETLKQIGLERVAALNKYVARIPLLDKTPNQGYQAQQEHDGWYITTHVNRHSAQTLINEIARELKIPVTVECFDQ